MTKPNLIVSEYSDTGFPAGADSADSVLHHGGRLLQRTTALPRISPPKAN